MVVAATVRGMRAEGTFTVASFIPAEITPPPVEVSTAVAVGIATMVKAYAGKITGRSATLFTSAFDPATGIGTYVAMESFEGSLGVVSGAFNYVHAASTLGDDRRDEHFAIVPSSGVGDLAGIHGAGGMAIDDDGTHRVWFDYEID